MLQPASRGVLVTATGLLGPISPDPDPRLYFSPPHGLDSVPALPWNTVYFSTLLTLLLEGPASCSLNTCPLPPRRGALPCQPSVQLGVAAWRSVSGGGEGEL